ncbi:Hypothetical protein SMA_1060 [Streptococcus macedonicus ACA-DC 198]|uniref:Uncharacterized protein n=1 Tax=Streptococcus gallolyticus TaxID=315405 RepID=A0A139QTY6_9STRE|nr:hypothetical protein SGADD03_01578 [Streptococcus gallolyticus]BAK27996.1 hypothetical protein SGGB_1128 [Streptococcus gallolyticus subsp. gallolyticus ATCC 43143]CCF02351.1 Hypothetical protein SMA_1060 [Streptococcus macedonicus ACA-DC 198]
MKSHKKTQYKSLTKRQNIIFKYCKFLPLGAILSQKVQK